MTEFENVHFSKQELLQRWDEGWTVCLNALESLTEEDLSRTIKIRSQPLNVVDAINRQLAHYGYHVGQIVYLGRWMKDSEWKSLSIPKGQSTDYTRQMKEKH
jgi:hypothetical protein